MIQQKLFSFLLCAEAGFFICCEVCPSWSKRENFSWKACRTQLWQFFGKNSRFWEKKNFMIWAELHCKNFRCSEPHFSAHVFEDWSYELAYPYDAFTDMNFHWVNIVFNPDKFSHLGEFFPFIQNLIFKFTELTLAYEAQLYW